MKVTDMMLDLETGDASTHDAYIQEAVGKVNVASAMFDLASKANAIANAEITDESMLIQEAADAGYPTDAAGTCGMACEAVKQSVSALYDLIAVSAKKIKESVNKDMKLVLTIGKKLGIDAKPENFADGFAAPLATALTRSKVKCDEARFLKSRYSTKIFTAYTKGITAFLMAFGLNITDVFKDPTIAKEVEKSFAGKNGPPATFKAVESYMSDAGKLIKVEKIAGKDSHYTANPSKSDLYDLFVSLYIVLAVSDAVIGTAGKSIKSTVMDRFNTLCGKEDCSSKKISKTLDSIGSDCKHWAANIENIADAITKCYTDSVYVLTAAVGAGGKK
jgi:hypothetical protein